MSLLYNYIHSFTGLSYLLISILLLLSILTKNKKLDLLSSLFIFTFSLIFLGFRDMHSGVDTIVYVTEFNSMNNNLNIELFYKYFMNILSSFTNAETFIFLNVFLQISIVMLITKLIKINNQSIVLYAYISMMPGFDMLTNGIRQGLSTTIIMLIFVLIYFNKKLNSYFIVISLFLHKSVLIFIPTIFLLKYPTKKLVTVLIYISIFIFIFWSLNNNTQILNNYISRINILMPGTSSTIGQKFSQYLLQDNSEMLSGILKYYFLTIILLFSFIFFITKNVIKEKKEILILSILFFYLVIPYAISFPSPYSYRFMYTSFLPGLLLSVLLIENDRKKLIFFYLITFIFGIFTYGSNTYSKFNLFFL